MYDREFYSFYSRTFEACDRMVVEPRLTQAQEEAAKYFVDPIPGEVEVQVKRAPRFEDMPWNHGLDPVMSGRLVHLIHAIDPGAITASPARLVTIEGGKSVQADRDYFVVRVRRMLECHDPKKVRKDYIPYVLDLAKIPEDAHLFRLFPYTPCIVASEMLFDRIREAGMTGPQFPEDDSWPPNIFGALG